MPYPDSPGAETPEGATGPQQVLVSLEQVQALLPLLVANGQLQQLEIGVAVAEAEPGEPGGAPG
jgi:hypothetical protein